MAQASPKKSPRRRRAPPNYNFGAFCPTVPFPESILTNTPPAAAADQDPAPDQGGGDDAAAADSSILDVPPHPSPPPAEKVLKRKMTAQFPRSSDNGMYSPTTPHANSVVVGIDKDKNSTHAVKYAIDHVLNNHHPNPTLILIHVMPPKINTTTYHQYNHQTNSSSISYGEETTDSSNAQQQQQLFNSFRGYCARRGVQVKEVLAEESDVAKGLIDYVNTHLINAIFIGSSTRNAIARKLSNRSDIASSLSKLAPPFCSLYIIAKQKAVMVRLAQRPAANTAAPPRQPSPVGLFPHHLAPPDQYDLSDPAASRMQEAAGYKSPGRSQGYKSPVSAKARGLEDKDSDYIRGPIRERPRSAPTNFSMESIDLLPSPTHGDSFYYDDQQLDFSGPLSCHGSMDITSHSDFSYVSDSSRESSNNETSSSSSSRQLEAEMRRLKLELKQTMDMYSSACKEAISAKQKAKELNEWKREEVRRFQEARQAEESAMAMAEMEKLKCRAAIEAAQKLAEFEGHRRRQAEFKAKKEAEEKNRALKSLAAAKNINDVVRYRKYSIEEIEEATSEFSESKKIGEGGGYGPVYKGFLDHTPVAIKVLRPDAAQGKKQFQQEVEVLCCIRHPNMVLLLGACPEYGCLVYEYMENGSLEDRLLRRGNSAPIPWRTRFKLSAEIATALLFLHQSKPEPLVHRDLKPANILLDRNYVSKIGDVGLARLVPPSVADTVTQYHITSAAGTFCYIDPEYQQTGMLTTKSDIYSLGIMLLQIITAKPAMGITHYVKRAIDKDKFVDMLDPAVSDWPVEEALTFAKMGLRCAELRKKDRPDLASEVLPELRRLADIIGNSTTTDSSCSCCYYTTSSRHGHHHSNPKFSEEN